MINIKEVTVYNSMTKEYRKVPFAISVPTEPEEQKELVLKKTLNPKRK